MIEQIPARVWDGLFGAGAAGFVGVVLSFIINKRKATTEDHTARANDVNKQRELLSTDEKTFRETIYKMWEGAQKHAMECEKAHNETQTLLLKAQRERDAFAIRLEWLESKMQKDEPKTIMIEAKEVVNVNPAVQGS